MIWDFSPHLHSGGEDGGKSSGIYGGRGQGKLREGLWKVYYLNHLVTLPLGCDVVALLEFVVPEREDPSTLSS